MSEKTTYDRDALTNEAIGDEPIGEVTRVSDFLPPPSELVPREETVKVTLALSKHSVTFFKEQAEKYHVPYQRMIRSLVDEYVDRHESTDLP